MAPTKIIVIVGPTAVGKTALSIAAAKAVDGEVISADSRQVYRGLDIGSGKITAPETGGVPHHLLDVADPKDTYTASDAVRDGTEALEEIAGRGKTPVVVGGSGFYIDALLGRRVLPQVPPDPALRKELEGLDLEALQGALKRLDPERYESIDEKNPRRLIRALEIAQALGKNPSPQHTMIDQSAYDTLWIGLTLPSAALKEKIRTRLHERLANGMLDEAKCLHAGGLSYERMEELGLEYRFMARHLRGSLGYDEMVLTLEKEIVAYAKRQMTWFKQNKDIHWFTPRQTNEVISAVTVFLNK